MQFFKKKLRRFNDQRDLFISDLDESSRLIYQESFIEARTFYNRAIVDIQKEHKEDVDYFLSPGLSRSPYEGNVFNLLFHEIFNANLKAQGIATRSIAKPPALALFLGKSMLSTLYHLFNQWFFARRHGNKIKDNTKLQIVVDEYLLPNAIQKTSYNDRYFPFLLDQLNEHFRQKSCLLFSFSSIHDYKELSKDFAQCVFPVPVIFKESFLKLSDYCYAFTRFFKVFQMDIPSIHYKGIDLSLMIRNEIRRQSFSHNYITSLLSYRFGVALKRKKIQIKYFINWYENQLIDKALNKGFDQFLPLSQRIGFQSWIVSPYISFNNAPSDIEASMGYAPQKVSINGKLLKERTQEFLYSNDDIHFIQAPSFRFLNIFKNTDDSTQDKERTKSLLILLPIQFEQSCEIIYASTKAMDKDPEIQLIVKFHPAFQKEWVDILKNKLQVYAQRVRYTIEALERIVPQVHIVISGSSSACIESLALQRFCIVYAPTLGAYESSIPVESPQNIWSLVNNEVSLLACIQHFKQKKLSDDDVKLSFKTIKDGYFTPLEKEYLQELLPADYWH